MDRSESRLAEIMMATATIILSAAFIYDGRDLQPGVFDPIGPAAVPSGVAWIAIALAGCMLIQALLRRRASPDGRVEYRWRDACLSAGLLLAYVTALALGIRYQWATILYLACAVLVLSARPAHVWPWALSAALVFGFGLDFLFRTILVTDLP